jgi:hypothetical protein
VGIPSVQTQTTLKQKKGREGKRLIALCAKHVGRMVVEITVKSTKPLNNFARDKALVMKGVEKDSVNTFQHQSGMRGEGYKETNVQSANLHPRLPPVNVVVIT